MGCSKVGPELYEVNVMKPFHCFQLEYHLTTDDQVDAGSSDWHALKANVNWMLRLEGYGSVPQ